jgi:hypothetical protein
MSASILAGLAGSPLSKVALKYWWLALPAGFAMWTLTRKRDKIDAAGLIQDFGTAFGPVIPLIVLCEMMADRAERQAAAAPAAPVSGLLQAPMKDADFSLAGQEAASSATPQFMPGGI